MPELRPYQARVIEECREAFASGARRLLLVAPTGAGKTVLASNLIEGALGKDRRALFLVHRRELLNQASRKLYDTGIDAGIIAAGFEPRPGQQVQVASISTLHSRAMRTRRMDLPEANLVVVDEAHHATAKSWADILAAYPEAAVIGLSATPCRADGRGLGDIFQRLVCCPDVSELVRLGFLVGTKVYAPPPPDLQGVKITGGDYNTQQLGERMNQDGLVGDVVTHWLKHSERRSTLVYAVDVAHSMHLRDEFSRAGISAGHIDGTTPAEERDAVLDQLRRGVLDVVCNCQVLTEGFDAPDVGCIVLARPTKSFSLYRQIVGRGLRPAKDKAHCIVLDHAGGTLEHGFVDEPVEWELNEKKRATRPAMKQRDAARVRKLVECPECGATRWQGRPCSTCGWRPHGYGEGQPFMDGDLVELDRHGNVRKHVKVPVWDPEPFYRQLLWIVQEHGYNPGWAAHKYREKFGNWPSRRWSGAIEPTPEVRSWVRSRQIAWSKSNKRPAFNA